MSHELQFISPCEIWG